MLRLHRCHRVTDPWQTHNDLAMLALTLHRLNLEVLLHVLLRKAKLALQLRILLSLHGLLHVEGIARGPGTQLLCVRISTCRDVRNLGVVVCTQDLDRLHHLLNLLLVLIHNPLLLRNLHLCDRVLKGLGEIDLHNLEPYGHHPLVPERVVDLLQHLCGNPGPVLPEGLRREVLRGVADHVPGEQQEALAGAVEAGEGEVDAAERGGHELELQGAGDADGLASAVRVMGVGARPGGNGRVVHRVPGPLQRDLRGGELDEAPEGPREVEASTLDCVANGS
mmetsp:Transcript_74569/g.218614  ORF Transcript_74569/g.218614 Transcript_74569/m.218614 type:complete len:279 (-) Transcript_74569:293-1129(-)